MTEEKIRELEARIEILEDEIYRLGQEVKNLKGKRRVIKKREEGMEVG